jgi:hypothetical protein
MNTLLKTNNDVIFHVIGDNYNKIDTDAEQQEKIDFESSNRKLHQFDIDDLVQKMKKES